MSKLSKLRNKPIQFFVDATINKYESIRSAFKPDVRVDETEKTLTFVFGFSPWKKFLKGWFSERDLVFLSKSISLKEFDLKWKNEFLKNSSIEVFIWGYKIEPYLLDFIEKNNIKKYEKSNEYIHK